MHVLYIEDMYMYRCTVCVGNRCQSITPLVVSDFLWLDSGQGVALFVYMHSVLPRNVSRHVGSVWLGRGLWTYQRFGATSFPTSKKNLYSRLAGPTCLKYAGENTGYDSIYS